jgi:cytoskeletal protein CcmA (bactofilin family)
MRFSPFFKSSEVTTMPSYRYCQSANPQESTTDLGDIESNSQRRISEALLPPESRDVSSASHQLSVVGPSVSFKGDLAAEEDLLIQGRVEGSITHTGSNLTIGAHANVEADITAQRVIVQGEVHGDIRVSESVVVEASAKVTGNIVAPRVGIKEGAHFKGSIDMEIDGAAQESSAEATERKTGSSRHVKAHEVKPAGPSLNDTAVDEVLG